MAEIIKRKLIILGTGTAGYTAAIYAARANLKPLVITGMQLGGQLTLTTEIENFPGFPQPVQGLELMDRMHKQCENLGVDFEIDTVIKTELNKMPFRLMTENGREYECDALIIATGSSARWLNIESEKKFKGKGISTCATCDGFFFRDKEVAIIGGGNTAVTEALFLAEIAKKVTIVHRRDEFRAEPTLVARLKEFKNIEIIWNSEVEEFLGDEKLEKIKLKNMKSNEESEINVDGAFLAIGHKPNTTMVEGELELDKKGYIVTKDNSTKTSVTGVFAAGDVQNIGWHQAITAAGFGCIAALEAQDYFMKK